MKAKIILITLLHLSLCKLSNADNSSLYGVYPSSKEVFKGDTITLLLLLPQINQNIHKCDILYRGNIIASYMPENKRSTKKLTLNANQSGDNNIILLITDLSGQPYAIYNATVKVTDKLAINYLVTPAIAALVGIIAFLTRGKFDEYKDNKKLREEYEAIIFNFINEFKMDAKLDKRPIDITKITISTSDSKYMNMHTLPRYQPLIAFLSRLALEWNVQLVESEDVITRLSKISRKTIKSDNKWEEEVSVPNQS